MIKKRLGEDFHAKITDNIDVVAREVAKKNTRDTRRRPRGERKPRENRERPENKEVTEKIEE
ncbi:MAG: hypothetical protein KDD45_12595 [Bdellovibrionales bacterium]|nr:hypothetical protein [Bdellovibrionales bacterium]